MDDDSRVQGAISRLEGFVSAHSGDNGYRLSEDLSLLKQEAQRWKIDPLTGLFSSDFTMKTLAEELKSSYGDTARKIADSRPVSLGIIDLDMFRQVNNEWGHLRGNDVLSEASLHFLEALDEALVDVRRLDKVGRYGGDEFVVVLPNTPLQGGYHAMDRIRSRIASQNGLSGVTVSGGITVGDAVGVPLLYDVTGRDLLKRIADYGFVNSSQNGVSLFSGVEEYSKKSGADMRKIIRMLINAGEFLKEKNIGVGSLSGGIENTAAELMIYYADRAMYHAKHNGKNRIYARNDEGMGTYSEGGNFALSMRA